MSNQATSPFVVVIPARYDSTRLPGKPLALIGNKPMVQWVYERSVLAGADQVIVATDDQRVFDAVKAFGGEVCMTKKSHESGTERLAEVIEKYKFPNETIIVNVQGDEPMIPPANIKQLASNLSKMHDVRMATLAEPILTEQELQNPNVVKVVIDARGLALLFSRSAIPFERDHKIDRQTPQDSYPFLRHIGIYAYQADFINQYVNWSATQLEQLESLEQLRVLWNGEKIHVDLAIEPPPAGVDTSEDLEQVRRLVASLKPELQ